MGRPRKTRTNPPIINTEVTPVTPVDRPPTKAELEHAEMVRNFQKGSETPKAEGKDENKSLKNLNDILDSSTIDEMFEEAKKDPTVIIAKSSVPEFQNNVDEPPKAPLEKVPDDVTLVGQKLEKGDEDAPFFLAADDPNGVNFTICDHETDRQIQDAFYANRATGTLLIILKDAKGNLVSYKDDEGKTYPLLALKNRKIYFKRGLKI